MAIYFTSDQHFGHNNIIEYCNRPFHCIKQMGKDIIENFNNIVNEEDIVWHLGDFSFHLFNETKRIFDSLNGTHNIVLGNHDRSIKYMQEVGFKEVVYSKHLTIDSIKLYLRHIPNHRTHDDRKYKDKYLVEPVEDYDYFICGHVHEKWKSKENIVNERSELIINVGVDQWNFKPVTLDEIINE
jgi:calcineurin-like phosphoesterase family protein